MHAAVWSHSCIARSKLRRCDSQHETPSTTAGKAVLGVGIVLTLAGGLLIVLGITGYFVRGDSKYYLSFGAPAGAVALFAGLSGTRSVSRREKTRQYAVAFAFLGVLSMGGAVAMVVLGAVVLHKGDHLLLTTLIGVAEIVISALICFLTLAGLGVTFIVSCGLDQRVVVPRPEPPAGTRVGRGYEPALPSDVESPEAGLSLISDIRARV